MDPKTDQLWLDLIRGMRNRACYFHSDNDEDGRNRNWYARKVYGGKYVAITEAYQNKKFNDASERVKYR